MFYERFEKLCKERNITPKAAVREMGFSNSLATKWKNKGAVPGANSLTIIADYFGVSTDFLLGNEKTEPQISEADLRFALFEGDEEITEAQWEEVKRFAAYVKARDTKQ